LNGTKLDSTEFTASNGTTVTLTTGATVDDIVELIAYTDVNITSVYNPWVNDTVGINTTSSVGIGTTANSTYELDVLGDIRSTGIITAANFYGDGSNLTGVSAGADILYLIITIPGPPAAPGTVLFPPPPPPPVFTTPDTVGSS
jgi:hypothetical protein